MPIRIDDVKRQRKEKDRQFEPAVERAQGVLLGLDSADSAEVRNRPGFVWYRRPGSTSSAAQALNRKLLPVPGLPVILQRVPPTGSWEVVDVDANTLSQLDDYQGAYLDRHAREHEPGGNDPLYVYLRMITPLRTTPGTGVAVSVAPLVYDNAGVLTTFGGNNNLSLSASVPGSGLARYVLVYLDPATNTLTTANGDTAPNGGAVALSFPAVPAGAVPSAYVRLEYGQTTITESDIVDARLLLNGMTTAGGYLKATGETTGATLQSQQFDLGVNIADNNGVGFYSTTPAIKAYLYQNEADDRFYISAETPVQFDMYQDDVIQVTDSSAATVLEFDPATGVLSTDGLDSVGGSGISVADDLLLASGADVYPNGDEAGLFFRTANNWISYGDHLNSLPSLTWATYTGFSTPTVSVASPSLMSVWHTAASRHFGYFGSYTGNMRARLSPARLNVIGTGIRIDDGSQNNYIQLYAETQTSGLVIYKYRQANGGVEGAAVSLFSGQSFLPQFVNMGIAISGTVAFLFLGLDSFLSSVVGVAVFTAWTPSREGFYHEQSAAGSDIQSASFFDACQ